MTKQFYVLTGNEAVFMSNARFFPKAIVASSRPLPPPWRLVEGEQKVFMDLDKRTTDLYFGQSEKEQEG